MRNRSTPIIPFNLPTSRWLREDFTTQTPVSEVLRRTRPNVAKPSSSQHLRNRRPFASTPKNAAFTLTEIMVVVVIIVLMIGMALPAFRVITGSRSEEGARNLIASTLGRARGDAIGLDRPVGVAFLYNPGTQKSYLAEVGFPDCPEITTKMSVIQGSCGKRTSGIRSYYFCWSGQSAAPPSLPNFVQTDYPIGSLGTWQWVGGPPLDMMPDTDLLPLPAGVSVQTVCNCNFDNTTGKRIADGYLSIGVILFDGKGRITSQPYGFARNCSLLTAAGLTTAQPSYPAAAIGTLTYYPNSGNYQLTQYGIPSQYGLVVFQKDSYLGQNFPPGDALYSDATPNSPGQSLPDYNSSNVTPNQQAAETWLDVNATPLLIDRYTGTVIKAE